MLDQIAGNLASVTADGAYYGDPVYRAVADRAPEAEVIIPPRSTVKPSAQADQAPRGVTATSRPSLSEGASAGSGRPAMAADLSSRPQCSVIRP